MYRYLLTLSLFIMKLSDNKSVLFSYFSKKTGFDIVMYESHSSE